jgi:glycosyltransferase involved in cell wall biosynthesis
MHSFSVVIPTYNAENTIQRTINSILLQTIVPSEIIVINDGSTDSTEIAVKRLMEKHNIIKYFNQAKHGVSQARNRGIRESTGDYILFLDSDDYWLNNKVATHIDHLVQHPQCKASFTNYYILNEKVSKTLTLNKIINTKPISKMNLATNIVQISGSASSMMCTKEALLKTGGFDDKLYFAEDLDLWIRLAENFTICEISDAQVVISKNLSGAQNQLLKDRKRWLISETYIYIWSKNDINFFKKSDKIAARKILRIDIRRHPMQLFKILYTYPKSIIKINPNLFIHIYKNHIFYICYIFLDFRHDLKKVFGKLRGSM